MAPRMFWPPRPGRVRELASRRPARVAATGLAAILVAVLLVSGARDSYPTTRVVQDSGLAWVTSDQIGSLTLLDGIAGQPVVNVRVTHGKDDPLQAGQAGPAGFALDPATGQLTRIDGSSYATQTAQEPLNNIGKTLQFLSGPRAADVVDGDENVAVSYDPGTLQQVSESLLFAAGPSNDTAVMDSSGRAWVLNQGSGRLAWLTATASIPARQAFSPGSWLVLADGEPVVVDTSAGRAYLIGPSGSATASLALGPATGSGTAFSGATAQRELVVADSAHGTYQTCSFGVGTCSRPRNGGFRGHIVGAAVTAHDHIYVPDYTAGTVWVLDPTGATLPVETPAVAGPGPFDLFDRSGLVFYNDPQSSRAGTIAADGTLSPIVKYSSGSSAPSATESPSPPHSSVPTSKPPATSPPSTSPPGTQTPSPNPGQSQSPGNTPMPHSRGGPKSSPTPKSSHPSGPGGPTASCSPGSSSANALLADSSSPPAPSPQTPVTLTDPGSTGVYGIAYMANGTLAVGDLNGSSYLWNVAAQKVTAIFPGTSSAGVFGLALSPDDRFLAVNTLNPSTNWTNAGIELWSTATCQKLATLNDPSSAGVGNPVEFSPDGGTLAADDANGCIYLWSTTSYKHTGTLCDPGIGDRDYGIAFSPTTGLLAAGDIDGTTYLWDTREQKILQTISEPGGVPVKGVAFSANGTLATSDNDGNVYLWNATTGTRIATLDGINGAVAQSIAFSPSGNLVAAAVNDDPEGLYEVIVWTATGQVLTVFRSSASIGGTRLAFSPDGESLAVGDENAHTYVWNVSHLGT